jgi:hypothetical protein
MAQIIKHRRGPISALKDVIANVGEFVMATGSIGDMNGPFTLIGDTAVAGGYKPISKIYQGSTVPTISVGSHGSTMDGVPFYSVNSQTLYILDKDGNNAMDLTGNIEGNVISGVTINRLTGFTGDFNYYVSASQLNVANDTQLNGVLSVSGETNLNENVNIAGVLTVTGETRLLSNLYVSGNLEILGTSTNINIESNTINIGDNTIRLNAYSPFDRYAGIEVYDSGSVANYSASLLWDSVNDYWLFRSSSGESSRFIGTTYNTYGSEISLTNGTIPIATSSNTIGDSLLRYSGTTLSYNTNKFTIDSSSGDITITGNLRISYSGSTDNGTKTTNVVFRNNANDIGYVSTTETTDVMDGILGYKHSDGTLVFSTLIDGGTY